MRTKPHFWTEQQKEYLAMVTPGKSHKEIHRLINQEFNLGLTISQIKGAISRYKLNTGRTGQFEKGLIPWNKGRKGISYPGMEKTQFKKGQRSINHKPIGSERICAKDGYTLIKTKEPRTWEHKHRVLWEQHNGSIPKGHVLVFLDGDKQNITLENLKLLSRAELAVANKQRLLFADKELTKAGLNVAKLVLETGKAERNEKQID